MFMQGFFADEAGAVGTDWIVLAAAVTGMGLAVASMTSGGLQDASGDISGGMQSAMEIGDTDEDSEGDGTEFVAATADLSATDVWDDPNANSKELSNVDQFSFSTVIDFTSDSNGIIFETGASGYGTVLYQHDGVLYLQAGRGNGYGEAADRGEASWQVAEGTATVEGSLNADGGLALIINGETVDQSSFTASKLAGGNAGSVAGSNSGVARNRGGYDRNDAGHPGVSSVTFFEDQTTGDELVPSN